MAFGVLYLGWYQLALSRVLHMQFLPVLMMNLKALNAVQTTSNSMF